MPFKVLNVIFFPLQNEVVVAHPSGGFGGVELFHGGGGQDYAVQ